MTELRPASIQTNIEMGIKAYRDRYQMIRAILRGITDAREPVRWTKLIYIMESSYRYALAYINDMENANLIKMTAGQEGKRLSRYCEITKKGRKILALFDAQAELIPTANWLNENINKQQK